MAILTFAMADKLVSSGLEKSLLFKEASYTLGKNIFLSHSTKDKRALPGVINFLEKYGGKVYIDKNDRDLPDYTCAETAEILKNEINKLKRFVVLVSENSKMSKWIPWELGLSDGLKGVSPIAILPIGESSDEKEWIEQEYLGLYPRIIYRKIIGDKYEDWHVKDPRDNKCWKLKSWIESKNI